MWQCRSVIFLFAVFFFFYLKHLESGLSHMWQMAFSLLLMNYFCLSTEAVQGWGEAFAFQIHFLKQGCICLMIALIVFKSEKQTNIIETWLYWGTFSQRNTVIGKLVKWVLKVSFLRLQDYVHAGKWQSIITQNVKTFMENTRMF